MQKSLAHISNLSMGSQFSIFYLCLSNLWHISEKSDSMFIEKQDFQFEQHSQDSVQASSHSFHLSVFVHSIIYSTNTEFLFCIKHTGRRNQKREHSPFLCQLVFHSFPSKGSRNLSDCKRHIGLCLQLDRILSIKLLCSFLCFYLCRPPSQICAIGVV